ncbi:MAG: type I DNA topoisomerase [Armatimonadota bacterium]
MSKPLIIVESPAKTKTLKNFLGGEYNVEASMGHIRDLPKKELGVDVADDFKPKYVTIPERKTILSHLKEAASKADMVYLATDPDREGEAIAWHLAQSLKLKDAKRITFNEITRNAVNDALHNPRDVDDKLVDAQQARRVLDRLVGYKLSPLLWTKVKKGLSAGRVQSVAVRLICDREREILAFTPEEYWSITAQLTKLDEERQFSAKLIEKDGKKIKLGDEASSKQVLDELQGADYVVADVKEREQKRNPAAPFITSTLQQEASRKLGFSNKKTMSVAQDLYEGIEIGPEGSVGLITYMRTDSVRVAAEAVVQAREFIQSEYGKEFVPSSPRMYKSKKASQDAHEAIRPTSVMRRPDDIAKSLNKDQYRLYKLIWQRFLASQMASAVFNVVTVDIKASHYTFRATGSTIKFAGFTILYTEGQDTAKTEDEENDEQALPKLSKDEALKLLGLLPKQHFTEPPPRYTEATLVKALEERGIGRPSTYATIISTIQDRKYVVLELKKFSPTDLGCTVTDLLVKHFPDIMNVEFTASVEDKLDTIEEGDLEWEAVMREFWEPFQRSLEDAKVNMEKVKAAPVESGEMCPNCGKPLLIRESRYGEFLGCSGYPECKTIVSRHKTVGVKCPMPGCEGQVIEKKSKRGKTFFGCDKYPGCTFVTWDMPLDRRCPKCDSILVEKRWYGKPQGVKCFSEECDYKESAKKEEKEEAAS